MPSDRLKSMSDDWSRRHDRDPYRPETGSSNHFPTLIKRLIREYGLN